MAINAESWILFYGKQEKDFIESLSFKSLKIYKVYEMIHLFFQDIIYCWNQKEEKDYILRRTILKSIKRVFKT